MKKIIFLMAILSIGSAHAYPTYQCYKTDGSTEKITVHQSCTPGAEAVEQYSADASFSLRHDCFGNLVIVKVVIEPGVVEVSATGDAQKGVSIFVNRAKGDIILTCRLAPDTAPLK